MLQAHLNNEKRTLSELKQVYTQALKDCEKRIKELSMRTDMENIQSIVYQKQYQQAIKGQLEGILEQLHSNEFATVSDFLTRSYQDGFVGAMYDISGQGIPLIIPLDQEQVVKAIQTDTKLSKTLYNRLGEDVNKLKTSIRAEVSRGIASGATWNEVAGKIAMSFKNTPFNAAYNNAVRIARTEGHRIQIQAADDAQHKAKDNGADIVKQWDSSLDSRTRKSHRKLDGQIRELDELFEVDGKKAMRPAGFGDPAEDINCRCALLQRAKWALDESELDTLKERASYFGLDKAKDFDDYKSKYLESTIPKTSALVKDNLRDYSEDEIKEIANDTNKLANKYIENASKWSGNIIVDNDGVEYGKLWNCDIKITSNTSPHIILHEQIHAHSISYYDAETYLQYRNIEEASVQLMTQEISKLENIVIIESEYDDMVGLLRDFNKTLDIYNNDFDFAKTLIEMPVTNRLEWLSSKVNDSMTKGISFDDIEKMNNIIDLLS